MTPREPGSAGRSPSEIPPPAAAFPTGPTVVQHQTYQETRAMRWRAPRSERMRSLSGIGAGVAVAALMAFPYAAGAQDAPAPAARTHTVKTGDTLWDIAATYLGDPFQWPAIYQINRDVVE